MTDWDAIKEEKQLNIDIATSWNTTKDMILSNHTRVPTNKDLSGKELAAMMKVNFPFVFDELRNTRHSVRSATAQAEKVVEAKKQPVVEQPKLVLD